MFDVFGYGTQVASSHKNKTEIEDRLHFFLEECDNLQVRGRFLLSFIFVDEILRTFMKVHVALLNHRLYLINMHII